MVKKEKIYDFLIKYIIDTPVLKYLPVKTKLKRHAIEGVITQKPPENEMKRLSLNECLNFERYNKVVENFINILEERFSYCDLSGLYKNIQTLKIEENQKKSIEKLRELVTVKASAVYSTGKNSIKIYSNEYYNLDKIMIHELLHMATTKNDNKVSSCGFCKTSEEILGIEIGRGLNEGYTEYLTNRAFLNKTGGAYEHLQSAIEGMEMIVGQKQMSQFYFSADLNGLISAMEKYASREEVLTIIQKMDYIYECYGKPGEKKLRDTLSRQVRCDLANINARQHKKLYEEGKISEDYYKNILFNLECYTHNNITFTKKDRDGQIVSKIITNAVNVDIGSPVLETSEERYRQIMDEYYESKKDNITYTYKGWKNKDGLGIDDIIKRESKSQEDKIKKAELERMIYNGQSTEIIHKQHLKPW